VSSNRNAEMQKSYRSQNLFGAKQVGELSVRSHTPEVREKYTPLAVSSFRNPHNNTYLVSRILSHILRPYTA
jgi:hypothetical protein